MIPLRAYARAFNKGLEDRMRDEWKSGAYRQEFLNGLPTGRWHWVPDNPNPKEWPDQNDARRTPQVTPQVAPHVEHADVTLCVDGASGDAALERRIAMEFRALYELFKERQKKYGPTNIAMSGSRGVAIRAQDKVARLHHAYFKGGALDTPDESVKDSWRDLSVYAAIALVCMDGGWPGAEG